MLGYGIYRRALEDSFHLEYIKKELYQDREEIEKNSWFLNFAGIGHYDREKGVIQMAVRKLICLKIMGSQRGKASGRTSGRVALGGRII